MAIRSVHVSVLLAFVAVVNGQNSIVQPNAKGSSVVEAVCSVLEASCLFADDKLFTRRLAYVESYDGEDAKTFRSGYYGGIWQLDEDKFNVTISAPALTYLSQVISNIRTHPQLRIDWGAVRWTDLNKPLYSAIGARLYLQYQSRNVPNGIPRSTADQAQFWVNYYRPTGVNNTFIQAVNRLNSDCLNAGTDIVFVLDASGSIGSANFLKVKQFVKDVIDAFDIGFDKTRVGIVVYSSLGQVTRPFDLSTYDNKTQMKDAVDRIVYYSGSTRTDLGIDMMTNVSFTSSRGARPVNDGHPRVAIVLTDGASDDRGLTLAAAKRMHDANILAFAIGVGSGPNVAELTAIASTPTCTYLILLDQGFNEIASLISVIEKKACEAPIVLEHEEDGKRINTTLPVGGFRNFQVKVTPKGITIKLAVGHGAAARDRVWFYISSFTYPSEAFYERRAEAWLGRQGVIFIEQPAINNTSVSVAKNAIESSVVYCQYRGTGSEDTTVAIGLFSGNQDLCQSNPCGNNQICSDRDTGVTCLAIDDATTAPNSGHALVNTPLHFMVGALTLCLLHVNGNFRL